VGGWSAPRPGRITPGEETRYSLFRWLGGPQGWSGRVRKISPQLGFDPRTVQPVASRYTDWAIPARRYRRTTEIILKCVFIKQDIWISKWIHLVGTRNEKLTTVSFTMKIQLQLLNRHVKVRNKNISQCLLSSERLNFMFQSAPWQTTHI
jgi:hypothetical protein